MSTGTVKVSFGLGISALLVFLFLRPITLMNTEITIAGLSVFEVFAAGMSYLLLVTFLINIQKLRFDLITFILIMFCLYYFSSLIWGSPIQRVARVIFPFILIFAVRANVSEQKHINALLWALFIGYLLPILLSTYSVVFGTSIDRTDYYSGVTRYSGAFQGPHPFAYAMLNFSLVYCLFMRFVKPQSPFIVIAMRILLVFSFFCLFRSGTRTALVGTALFWLIYSFSYGKKFRYSIIVMCGLLAIMMSQNFQKIFWKTGHYDLNIATSGRIEVWEHNIDVFKKSTLFEQIFGQGVGETMDQLSPGTEVLSSHNDYLELLMDAGVFGLLLYLLLIGILVWDIVTSSIGRNDKILFGAILISIAVMNFGSNASIFRVENAQYFWFYMGLFYRMKEMQHIDTVEPINYKFPTSVKP